MFRTPFASHTRTLGLVFGVCLLLMDSPTFAGGWHLKLPFHMPSLTPNNSGQNGDQNREDSQVPSGPDGPLPNTYYDTHPANVSDADKKTSDKLVDQGNALIHQGHYQDAIRPLLNAIQANPNNAIAYNDLGAAYMDLKQNSIAAVYFTESIRRAPSMVLPYRNLGLLHDATDASQAIPYYTKVLQLTPNDSQVWAWRGYDYAVTGNSGQAMYDYTRALHLNAKYADAYHWRGKLELNTKHDRAGYADLRHSRVLDPALGPVIAQEIHSVMAQRHAIVAQQRERQRIASQMPSIRRVVREGPRYYEAVYQAAVRDGDTNQEARDKEQQAENDYNRDVALQNAWEHGDEDTLNNIEAGNMSQDEIDNYNADDQPSSNSDGGSSDNGGDTGGGNGDEGGGDTGGDIGGGG
jgi:tetratricopeptide (TPR) repeat protein